MPGHVFIFLILDCFRNLGLVPSLATQTPDQHFYYIQRALVQLNQKLNNSAQTLKVHTLCRVHRKVSQRMLRLSVLKLST